MNDVMPETVGETLPEESRENTAAGVPEVSVIVPVYNTGGLVRETIKAILKQTFTDFELILVDDGSKDGVTPGILDEYAREDARVRVFHRENGGVARARNFGLEVKRGKYVVFCDSDDIYALSSFQVMHDTMEKTGVDLVLTGYCRFKKTLDNVMSTSLLGKEPLTMFSGPKELCTLFLAPGTNLFGISIWAKMYRSDILDKYNVRFPEGISYEEDCCFNTRYFRKVTSAAAVNRVCYYYRQQDLSLSKGYRKNVFPFLVNGFRERKALLEEVGLKGQMLKAKVIFGLACVAQCQKLIHSDLTKEERMEEYRMMLSFPETPDCAKSLLGAKRRRTRMLAEAMAAESPEQMEKTLRLFAFTEKVDNFKAKIKKLLGQA